MSNEGISGVVAQRLMDRDTIVKVISHRVTEKWPPAFKEEDKRKPWTLQSLRDNVFQSSEASASRLTTADGLKASINEWVMSGKVVLVGVNADGSMGVVLTNEKTTHIDLSVLVKFDDATGILLPSDIPADGEEIELCSKCGEKVCSCAEPVSETCEKCGKDPCSCSEPPPPPPPTEEVEMTFTVPAKKLNSIGMAMSMNFDDATAKIEFKGKPRKGTGSNPVSALKDAINSAGGDIED
jgi:hypothetical protein